MTNRKISLITAVVAVSSLAGCGGGGLADSPTLSTIVPVSAGEADIALTDKRNDTVRNSRVGLVAFATGIDVERGQIVAAAGIEDGANVGQPVTSGTVTYDTGYNYKIVDNIERSDTFISGDTIVRRFEGQTVLTADFGSGELTGQDSILKVDGRINGQAVSGTATVTYAAGSGPFGQPAISGIIPVNLDGRIGSTGVIATIEGNDENTVIAGGLVGIAN